MCTLLYMKYFTDSVEDELNADKSAYMLATCTCLNLRKASRAITQMFDEALKPSGLRSTQLPVLATLVSSGQTTVNRLADDLVMDRTSLSRLLQPLVTQALVKMAPGEDRRTRDLSITPLGRESVAAAIPMWVSVQDEVYERLGQSRWRDLIENLAVAAALTA